MDDEAPAHPGPEAAPAADAAEAPPGGDAPGEAPPPAPTRQRRGWLLLGGLMLTVVAVAVFVMASRPTRRLVAPSPVAPIGPGPLLANDPPRLPTPVVGPGDQVLAGVVVDGAGLPVEALVVTAAPESAVAAPGPDPTAVAVVAFTGADGHVELRGLVPGRYRITLEGDAIFTSEVRYVAVPSDLQRFVVARQVALAGVVTDGGRPAPDVTVALDSDTVSGGRTVTTDRAGRFELGGLPEGSYRVWAHRGDRAARAVWVPRLGRGPFADVTLALEAAAIVTGRVVDRQTGGGVAAAVTLSPDDGDEAPRHARTDGNGWFKIEGVPYGRWSGDAWAPGWFPAGAVGFAAGRGDVTIELVPGGVIEGRVVDEAGSPVAGAQVAAIEDSAGGREVSAAAADEQLRRALGLGLRAPAGDTAALGDDGQFLARGELGVVLGPIPFAPPPGAARTSVSTPIDRIDLVDPVTAVAAVPVDPAYVPAWVTDGDGRFRIIGVPAGAFVAVAEAAGFPPGRSARRQLAIGQVATGVDVTLARGAMVAGRVTDQRGAAVPGALIKLAPADAVGGRGVLEVVADGDGRYRAGPVAGRVAVTARAFGHADYAGALDLARPPAGLDPGADRVLDITLVVADAAVEGVVEDPSGLPVLDARIVVTGGSADGRATVAGPGGRFRIAMLPDGPLLLTVEHPGYPPQRFEQTTGDAARLRLAYGGGLALLVLDHHTGASLGGLPVSAVGPGRVRREVTTGLDGTLTLAPIAAGTWTVTVRTPGYVGRGLEVAVPAGDRPGQVTVRDLRLELERGATVTGTVRDRAGDRVAGVTVRVRRGGEQVTATTDADGDYRLVDVPTGAVTLTADKDGLGARAELELRPGDERGGLELTLN
ncbi:MAG: carboxypeptidase-like regulatory domain-containing protein [Kofleriaceae bacterium]